MSAEVYMGTDSAAMCPNGPDGHGNWPCDPDPHGDGTASCAVCGYRARWLPVCEHTETDRVGWQNGVPLYECRRCNAVVVYPGHIPARVEEGEQEA